MLNSKNERELAYIVKIDDILPMDADRLECACIGGWRCVVGKGEFHKDDYAVFFEIDAKLPEVEPFTSMDFLKSKHYKIKSQKIRGVVSQGLLVPLSNLGLKAENYCLSNDSRFLTKELNVTYAVAEDNKRKSNKNKSAKFDSMNARHSNLAKKKWWRWLMKRGWGRNLLFFFFGKKKDNPREFPNFVAKTDEERIENCTWRLSDLEKYWIVTEKLDGTSCTYALERKPKNKFEFYVCSRNVRQKDETQECYHDHNIYWDLAFKYNIEDKLKDWLNTHPEDNWVCLQGEGVGAVQGNPLELEEDDLYVFNFITSSNGRLSSLEGRDIVKSWDMKWVPIIGKTNLVSDIAEMKKLASGKSLVNPRVLREGLVYRSLDGKESFKNVSNEYLLKKKD